MAQSVKLPLGIPVPHTGVSAKIPTFPLPSQVSANVPKR